MLDPLLVLATAMQTSKGAYALLIGSGVSRGASIPTGWDVTIDLVRKIAERRGAVCDPDPAAWFESEYAAEPSYSKILAELGRTGTERRQLLRGYFEPTESEAQEGLKVPAPGHRAIARMVKRGHVRVIVTTNFDRLLERALDEEGVVAQVVSTADAVKGMLPMAHSQCTVIKLHGDYMDARLRNTEEELTAYPRPLQRLLNQVLEDYGLVICGWSGEWDLALCESLRKRANRRFSTFWTVRGEARLSARQLIAQLGAQELGILDADDFLTRLDEAIHSMEDLEEPPAISTRVAVATLKRLLADPHGIIRASDLVVRETESLTMRLQGEDLAFTPSDATPDGLQRLELYENLTRTLGELVAVGCYWGSGDVDELWPRALRRIANSRERHQGYAPWLKMSLYPALLLMYAGGIAAVHREKYSTLAGLLLEATVREGREEVPLGRGLYTGEVMSVDSQRTLPGFEKRLTPLSDHLAGLLPAWLHEIIPDPQEYLAAFDLFEYFLGLVHFDLLSERRQSGSWGPMGCFAWRGQELFDQAHVRPARVLDKQQANAGSGWTALKVGFFGGSEERYRESKDGFDDLVRRAGGSWL